MSEERARLFHETYERLAPQFGYETRADTKQFDPTTPNGRLMIAVVREMDACLLGEIETRFWSIVDADDLAAVPSDMWNALDRIARAARNRDMWKGQCERQAEKSRKVSEAVRHLLNAIDMQLDVQPFEKLVNEALAA
jgi:hypothetical protein